MFIRYYYKVINELCVQRDPFKKLGVFIVMLLGPLVFILFIFLGKDH